MFKAILYNLSRLPQFRGRDPRARFWPYAAAVIALAVIANGLIVSGEIESGVAHLRKFAADHPELVSVRPGSVTIHGYHPDLLPDVTPIVRSMVVTIVAAIGLLASAIARRLRDAGKNPLLGFLPLPFLVFGFFTILSLFNRGEFSTGVVLALFANNLAYIASLAALVVMLARPSAPIDLARATVAD